MAGVIAGGIYHVVMATLGISVLLKLITRTFNALLLAGALCITWIGVSLLRANSAFGVRAGRRADCAWITFRRGPLTCLMNPEAYLFMLAVFPQFLRAQHGVTAQSPASAGAAA